jgi:hypothetical protein
MWPSGSIAALVLVALAAAGGCGSAGQRHTVGRTPPSRVAPSRVVEARHLHASAPGGLAYGAPLPKRDLGVRAFADGLHGFALTRGLALAGATYPAASSDGGRSWHVDGPILHIPAAQGAVAVDEAGVEGAWFYYAWGGGATTVVDVATDRGKHWWQVFLPATVLSVTPDRTEAGLGGGLTAIVAGPTTETSGRGASLWIYHTADGRTWRHLSDLNVTSRRRPAV